MKNLLLFLYVFCASTLFAQNTNLSNGVVFDGEPYIAVNPTNSQHLVVAWMGWIDFTNKFQIKVKTSFDGGQTWSSESLMPHTVSGYSSADPCIDFNLNGDVFVSYIDFTGTTPPVTGGIYLCKSTDGGLTWEAPLEVINTNFDGTKWPIDRPWMVIDKSTSPNQGNIYITTFNLNRTNPAFNPYLSVSNDDGNSFTTRYVDTTGWLAGSLNPLPMCSPAVSSSGVFYGAYPSYVITQSLYTQGFLASSTDGGVSMNHDLIVTNQPNTIPDDSLAKKAALLLCNPANPDHLANVFLSTENGDIDVFLRESFDAGSTWNTGIRINDDPIANNRMQDMIWGDFDTDGDLVISWRDRRNGSNETYETESEFWGAFRDKDSAQFEPNFQITDQTVSYDTDLGNAGCDFMCIKMQDDIINAVWNDPRDGEINIWYQKMNPDGSVLSTTQITSDKVPGITVFPNPTESFVTVNGLMMESIQVFDQKGQCVLEQEVHGVYEVEIDMRLFSKGTYTARVKTDFGEFSEVIVLK
jgi:hypothetical protein